MSYHASINLVDSLRTSLVALIIVVAAFFPYSSASAQGTQGTLPKPITSRELASYAKRLALSDQQRHAVEPIHDEYRKEFRQLRENDIQEFLDESAKLSSSMTMPKRETVEKMYKDVKRLSSKIKNLDKRFFNQMELLLDETQQTIMPRVRLARERARYRQGAMAGIGAIGNSANVDLSEIYSKLNLSLDEAAETHSIIVNYEKQLTSATKEQYEAAISMMLDMVKAFEDMGITDTDMSDPESMEKLMKAAQSVYAEVGKKVSKNTEKISGLNRKTVKKIAAIISPENARDLKQNFYRKAYPMASFNLQGSQKKFELALGYPDLNEEQRQLIKDAASAHQIAHDRITEEMVDFLEDFSKSRSVFDAVTDQNYWKDYQQKMSEFQTRRQELDKTAKESLDAQLGHELVAKINDPRSWANAANAKPTEAADRMQQFTDSEEAELNESFISFAGLERHEAAPISTSDLTRYAEKLKLNDQQLLIIQELHQQYQEQYHQFAQEQQEEMQNAFQELAEKQQSGDMTIAYEYQDLSSSKQNEKLEMLGELDTAFFDDVQLLIDETSPTNALERLRLARQRVMDDSNVAGSFNFNFMPGGESNESHVDLTSIIDSYLTDLQITSKIDLVLLEYEKKLTSEFAKRHVLEIQSQKRSSQLMKEMMARQSEDLENGSFSIGMEYSLAMQEVGEVVRKADKMIAAFNRETLNELLVILDDSSGNQLQRAYKRACYPNVYQNVNSGEQIIQAARKLHDLSDEQRMSLNLYELEFQSHNEVLCDKMIDVYEQPGSATSNSFTDPQYVKEYQQRQQKLQVIQFDRNELGAKAKRRLQQILSPAQLERIGLRKARISPG